MLRLDASDMRLLSNDILEQVTQDYEDTIVAVRNEIVRTTPVLSGKGRKNWQMSENLNDEIIEVGGFSSSLFGESAGFNVDFNKNVHIFNNVDYIGYLDEGTVHISPRNFTQNAITSVIRRLNR
jgi:hypothetical protein